MRYVVSMQDCKGGGWKPASKSPADHLAAACVEHCGGRERPGIREGFSLKRNKQGAVSFILPWREGGVLSSFLSL